MLVKYIKSVFFFYILVIVVQGCKKNCEENARNYTFNNKIILECRRLDTIRIGDTILINSKIKFLQKNNNDSIEVSIKDVNFEDYGLWLTNINNINGVLEISGLSSFNMLPINGTYIIQNSSLIRYKFQKQNDAYSFIIKLIPTKPGLVRIGLFSIKGEMPKSCSVFTINNSFQNYNLNHSFYYNLVASNDALLAESDFFIWVK